MRRSCKNFLEMAQNIEFSSPAKKGRIGFDINSVPCSPPIKDITMYPWNWGAGAHISLSPSSSCGSPEADSERRRGRPRADTITNLIVEGSQVKSNIKCKICNRVFPREKSLQAHMRTHTGERPYVCDFPGCGRAFCQSGQLKTHQRLHTGEKPFVCTVSGCDSRFTHANRHCPDHPYATLRRESTNVTLPENTKCDQSGDVVEWMARHAERQQSRAVVKGRPQKMKRSLQDDIENEAALCKRPLHRKSNVTNVQKSYDNCGENSSGNEHQDKLLGALALIQLAHGAC